MGSDNINNVTSARALRIFAVDDGSIFHVAAFDHEHARRIWVQAVIDQGSATDEASAIADFGEPKISIVQLVDAARVKVHGDDETETCPRCHGRGCVEKGLQLDEVFRRARGGEGEVLCCSEY